MKNARLFAALIGLSWATAPLCANTVRTVSLSYEWLPGNVSGFSLPVISDLGQTAFLNGFGVNVTSTSSFHTGTRAWSEASGSIGLVAGVGDVLPNAPNGLAIAFFNQFGVNNSGRMALRIGYSGTNSPFSTYIQSSNGLEHIATTGDPAPGLPNHTFGALDYLILNDASQVAVRCDVNLSASSPFDSIWRQEVGAIGLVAKSSNSFSTFGAPALNDDGIIVFRGENTNIWVGQPSNIQMIAARGAQAPGAQSGETFNTFFPDPVINSAGHVAFSSSLSGSGGSGIWSNRSGAIALVVRNGDQAPNAPEGVMFAQVTVPVLNDADHVLFRGTLTGSEVTTANDSGLWSDTSGTLQLVIREGDAAPGTPSGIFFGQFDINSHVLNASNQIAFLGRLTGTDVTTANDVGIWATD